MKLKDLKKDLKKVFFIPFKYKLDPKEFEYRVIRKFIVILIIFYLIDIILIIVTKERAWAYIILLIYITYNPIRTGFVEESEVLMLSKYYWISILIYILYFNFIMYVFAHLG